MNFCFSVICENRPYSYETTDTTRLNAMLNSSDVSEYLKISPDGLQVSNHFFLFTRKVYI